jgi:hypothetical protein
VHASSAAASRQSCQGRHGPSLWPVQAIIAQSGGCPHGKAVPPWAMRFCQSESVLWPQVALTLQALVPARHAAPCPLASPCNGCPLESQASTELNSRPCTKTSTRRTRYVPTQWLREAQPVPARKTSVSRRCSHCRGRTGASAAVPAPASVPPQYQLSPPKLLQMSARPL